MNAYFGNIVNNESRSFHGRAYLDLVCVFSVACCVAGAASDECLVDVSSTISKKNS